jgi:hypothetical protein
MTLEARESEPAPRQPFRLHIGHVAGLTVEKQVVRIHASPNIAAVANDHPQRNRTMPDRPRPSVGVGCAALVVEPTVSSRRGFALPDQATGQRISTFVQKASLS